MDDGESAPKPISFYFIFAAICLYSGYHFTRAFCPPVAGVLTVALFLSLMIVLTMISLAFIGREAGRFVAGYISE